MMHCSFLGFAIALTTLAFTSTALAQPTRCDIPSEAQDIWRCENGFVIGPENVIIRMPIPETDPEALYNAGVETAKHEDWRVAIAYFTAAHQRAHLVPNQEALLIAPWWGDAYYNLGTAQELAGQFDAAKSSFKLYILTGPGEKEVRDAQDRIYALNAKADLAKTEIAEKPPASAKAAKNAAAGAPPPPPTPSFDGARFVNRLYDGGGTLLAEFIIEVHGNQISDIVHEITGTAGAGTTSTMACVLNGSSCNLCCGTPGTLGGDPASRYVLEIAADGRAATRKFYLPDGNLAETRVYDRQ